jgi:hypothetical protein
MEYRMIQEFDDRQQHCPRLGHFLNFGYCRTCQNQLPCFKIMDCWYMQIPIQEYLEKNFSAEQIQIILAPPKPKMISILEIVESVRKNNF